MIFELPKGLCYFMGPLYFRLVSLNYRFDLQLNSIWASFRQFIEIASRWTCLCFLSHLVGEPGLVKRCLEALAFNSSVFGGGGAVQLFYWMHEACISCFHGSMNRHPPFHPTIITASAYFQLILLVSLVMET